MLGDLHDVDLFLGFVGQQRRQPALRLGQGPLLACGVVDDLLAADAHDAEIARLRMAEVPAAHRRRRGHHAALGEVQAEVAAGVEEVEERPLLGVVGAGGVTRRRPDAPVGLADEGLAVGAGVGRVAPQVVPDVPVQAFGEGLGQAVGQGLGQDGAVVVAVGLVAGRQLVGAKTAGDGEGADPVGAAARLWRNQVGQAGAPAAAGLGTLAAQVVQHRAHVGAGFVGVDHDVVAAAGGREEAGHATRLHGVGGFPVVEHGLGVGQQAGGLDPQVRVIEDGRVAPLQLPGVEERRPVDERPQLGQGHGGEHGQARHPRSGRLA